MIGTSDIAACAVTCPLSDHWDGEVFEPTGPETHSYFDVADTLSELTGKQVKHPSASPEDIYAMIESAGWGDSMAWGGIYEVCGHKPNQISKPSGEPFHRKIS